MRKMSDSLVLKIFCVDRQLEVNDCDCVLLSIAEDAKGRFSGSYGIKKGHAKAVFSLKKVRSWFQMLGKLFFLLNYPMVLQ